MPLSHIHPEFQHIVGMSNSERIAFMGQPRWLNYPSAERVLKELHELMEQPKKPRLRNLFIVSDPHNGKTTIVRYFGEKYGQGYVDEESMEPVKPIIITESPPTPSEKGLYTSILNRFFTPYRDTDSPLKLRNQVVHLLRYCKTKILIIDEIHTLLSGTMMKQREVMNTIKYICNEVNIPVVGVGIHDAIQALHTDKQHASRFDVMILPLWTLDKNFQRLLVGFEKILPLKKPSRLHQPELAMLLHALSGGNLGDLHRLLVECAGQAINSGKELIDKSIIEDNVSVCSTNGIRELKV